MKHRRRDLILYAAMPLVTTGALGLAASQHEWVVVVIAAVITVAAIVLGLLAAFWLGQLLAIQDEMVRAEETRRQIRRLIDPRHVEGPS